MARETAGTTRDIARLADGAQTRRRCARSTARRLVRGAGVADAVAYRQDPQRDLMILAHGVTAGGDWLVALADVQELEGRTQDEVRIQIEQLGAPAEVRVQVASLHALGTLRVVTAAEAEALLADDVVPEPVRAAAGALGAALAVLEAADVLVHAREDVEKLPWEEISSGAAFPVGAQEWHAVDAAAAVADSTVEHLLADLARGARRGILGRPVASPEGLLQAAPRHLLLDVDAEGCTWLVHEGEQVRAVFLAFGRSVRDEGGLREALQAWRLAEV